MATRLRFISFRAPACPHPPSFRASSTWSTAPSATAILHTFQHRSSASFLSQIGAELGPDSFTLVVTIPAPEPSSVPQVIAAGSALPAVVVTTPAAGEALEIDRDVSETTVQRSAAARRPVPGTFDWELKHLCVCPEYMRQGLAGSLLQMLEAEVRERVHGLRGNGHGQIFEGRIRLMITTINELNGPWYQRKGYNVVERSSHPVGTLGGTAAFEIWHMNKILT